MTIKIPNYLNPLFLIKEYRRRVPDYEKLTQQDYYTIMSHLEEEIILELADNIKKNRREKSDETNIKGFGE